MTAVTRVLTNVLVWLLALVGLASACVWGATRLGVVEPLVVISGSMEPRIMTGDLVVDRPTATADLQPGEVVSLRSAVTGDLVTHRVVAVAPQPDGTWQVTLKGDANPSADGEPYVVGDRVWHPVLRIPGGGRAVVTLTRPSVAIPLGVTLLALLGLSLLRGETRREPAHAAGGPRVVTTP